MVLITASEKHEIWTFRAGFFFNFVIFNTVFNNNIADDRIRPTNLWCQKGPLYPLRHNFYSSASVSWLLLKKRAQRPKFRTWCRDLTTILLNFFNFDLEEEEDKLNLQPTLEKFTKSKISQHQIFWIGGQNCIFFFCDVFLEN